MRWFAIFVVFLLLIAFPFKSRDGAMNIKTAMEAVNEEIFDMLITRVMKMAHMSALSAAIIKDGKVVWAKGYGLYLASLIQNLYFSFPMAEIYIFDNNLQMSYL